MHLDVAEVSVVKTLLCVYGCVRLSSVKEDALACCNSEVSGEHEFRAWRSCCCQVDGKDTEEMLFSRRENSPDFHSILCALLVKRDMIKDLFAPFFPSSCLL